MLYKANTPAEYLDLLTDDWRKEKLEELRTLLQIHAPDLKEGINYKMLCYGDDKGHVFHLNAQMNYVSLYVGDSKKIDPDGELLKGLDIGKGCIRFKKTTVVGETKIDQFIAKSVELWGKGVDIDC